MAARHPVTLRTYSDEPRTLNNLLRLPVSELKDVDIARMNLLCAKGLPGSKNLDIDYALTTLDKWARRVAFETHRKLYRVTDPRYAAHYHHSEAYFRAELLAQVLMRTWVSITTWPPLIISALKIPALRS